MKKYLFTLILLLFIAFIYKEELIIKASGTCKLTQGNTQHSIDTPFYWYTAQKRSISYNMQITSTYQHTIKTITSKEDCLNISGTTPNSVLNNGVLDITSTNYYFSKSSYSKSEEIFNLANEAFTNYQVSTPITSEFLSLDNLPPVIVTENLNPIIVVPVQHTINANYLLTKMTAYDEVDGEVSVIVFENNYSGNTTILGNYDIIFAAKDEANNYAYLTVTIQVIDNTKPSISGQTTLISNMSNPLTIDQIKKGLIIEDNYYTIPNSKLVVAQNNFTGNEQLEGSFTISFKVTDDSNNTSDIFTVTIENHDDIPPSINGQSSYEISNKVLMDINQLKSQVKATDNIDANPVIQIKNDGYSDNYYKIGIYQVTLFATDKFGNISSNFTININVKDLTEPTFYISQKFIGIDGQANISIEQLMDIIEETNNISTNNLVNKEIITDEYTPNKNIAGKYLVELQYEYENSNSINIQTYIIVDTYIEDEQINTKKDPKLSFWDYIKNFFLRIWNFIKQIFSFKWLKLY